MHSVPSKRLDGHKRETFLFQKRHFCLLQTAIWTKILGVLNPFHVSCAAYSRVVCRSPVSRVGYRRIRHGFCTNTP
jgi:hypothetical protein